MTLSDRTALEAAAEAAYPDDPMDPTDRYGRIMADRAAFVKGAESRQAEIDRERQNGKDMTHLWQTAATERDALRARIDKALACYGQTPGLKLGESRWKSADEFLIAIRAALTEKGKP